MKYFFCILFALCSLVVHAEPKVGVFYFPGWSKSDDYPGLDRWDKIRPFAERKPYLGWYDDSDDAVASQHLEWMKEYKLSFVIYDWYWSNKNGLSLNHAIDAYRRVADDQSVKYGILWANHFGVPNTLKQFDDIVDYWIQTYFFDARYLQVDNMPVVFIFSPDSLFFDGSKFGMTSAKLLERAREKARNSGLKGIYFVGSANAVSKSVENLAKNSFDAISAYNYHSGYSGSVDGRHTSRSYKELILGYQESWDWILKNSSIPYILPITAGWDKRPWGGSKDPLHDLSYGDSDNFKLHIESAYRLMLAHPDKTKEMGVVCCWNEFGEGSYIEPSEKFGFDFLFNLRSVFGDGKN